MYFPLWFERGFAIKPLLSLSTGSDVIISDVVVRVKTHTELGSDQ